MRRMLLALLVVCTAACAENDGFGALTFGLEVAPELDFGERYAGRTHAASFAVSATGTGSVEIIGLHSDAPELGFDEQNPTVMARTTVEVPVYWTPTQVGPFHARLRLFAEVDARDFWWVEVSGTGIPEPQCDDANPCTFEYYDFFKEDCVYVHADLPCDDASACTEGDWCFEGECRGDGITCDDETDCTDDFCDTARGCVFLPVHSACPGDGDLCTVDTCESGAGCTYPAAPNNTICGLVDCEQLNVCIRELGGCYHMDITGNSDGVPCNDGNPCTENDQCLNGECNPGFELRATPAVIQIRKTYGGAGSTVAADPPLYLFADPDALVVTEWVEEVGEEETMTALVHRNTISLAGALPPLALGGAAFFVATTGGDFGVLGLSNPQSPVWLWQAESEDPDPPSASYTAVERRVTATAATVDGILFSATFTYRDNDTVVAERAGVYYAALAAPDTPVSTPVQLAATSAVVDDLDAYEDAAAWASGGELRWLRLDAVGSIIEEASRVYPGGRFSLFGRQVALWEDAKVVVDEVQPPAAGSVFAPFASFRFFDGFDDLVLTATQIFVARNVEPLGVMALPLTAGLDQQVTPALVDAMPAARLDRGAGHLLVAGELALPLAWLGGSDIAYGRISGPYHGDITALADGEEEVLCAGPVAYGRYHLRRQEIVEWGLRWGAATRSPPWIVRGLTRDVPIPAAMIGRVWPWGPECEGYLVETFSPGGDAGNVLACGLYPGARYTAAGGRLWAFTPTGSEGTWDEPALRAWDLDSEDGQPVIEVTDVGAVIAGAPQTYLRPSATFAGIAVSTAAEAEVRVELYDAGAGALAPPAGALFDCDGVECLAAAEPARLGIDGTLLLRGETDGRVCLYAATTPPASVSPRAEMTIVDATGVPRIWELDGDRAWIGWETAAASHFRQVQYTQGSLDSAGDVALPAAPVAVLDAGDLVVTAVLRGIVVVEPACYQP